MAKISLSEGFSLIPEGETVFKITEVIYKEEFGKLEVNMVTASGQKHTERFTLVSSNGEPNEGAINAFSFFAKTAMNDFTLDEIDHNDLVGHYIRAIIAHDVMPSNRDPKKTVTFIRLSEKYPADGFDEVETPKKTVAVKPTAPATPKVATRKSFNLDELLG